MRRLAAAKPGVPRAGPEPASLLPTRNVDWSSRGAIACLFRRVMRADVPAPINRQAATRDQWASTLQFLQPFERSSSTNYSRTYSTKGYLAVRFVQVGDLQSRRYALPSCRPTTGPSPPATPSLLTGVSVIKSSKSKANGFATSLYGRCIHQRGWQSPPWTLRLSRSFGESWTCFLAGMRGSSSR